MNIISKPRLALSADCDYITLNKVQNTTFRETTVTREADLVKTHASVKCVTI